MRQTIIRTYSELILIPTFEERFEYLKLDGRVGEDTFGFDRYLNQIFYRSPEWKSMRNYIITRDNGCDLGIPGREIIGYRNKDGINIGEKIMVHHMNPIAVEDIRDRSDYLLNPEYLICTRKITHDAIHYGDKEILYEDPIVRFKNDTCPWRR